MMRFSMILLLFFLQSVCCYHPFLMPYPSYATVTSKNEITVQLQGIIYTLSQTSYRIPIEPGLDVKYLHGKAYKKLWRTFAYMFTRRTKYDEGLERSKLFHSTPIVKKIPLYFEVFPNDYHHDLSTWRDYGKMRISHGKLPDTYIKIKADSNGYFSESIAVNVSDNYIFNHGRSAPTFWMRAGFEIEDQFFATEFPVKLMTDSQLQVVSDIDDTILTLKGDRRRKLNLFLNSFLKPFTPVDYMLDLYKSWSAPDVSFHYASGVLWPMVPSYVNQFFLKHKFPWITFLPRSSSILKQIKGTLFKSGDSINTYDHKVKAISAMMDMPEWKRVVFVGDSTKYDYKVYADMAEKYRFTTMRGNNGKVQCIFLRYVKDRRKPYHKFKREVSKLYDKKLKGWKDRVYVFSDARSLKQIDIKNGHCHTLLSRFQWMGF